MKPWIVMRARNDLPLVAATLAMLARQRLPHHLLVMDNASTDGTRAEAAKYTEHIIDIPAGAYVPGRVLNQAMARTDGAFVVFVNSDCTPQHDDWLERLLAGFRDEKTAAVFGRQIPRPECTPLFAKDTEDTYGDGARQHYWRHCFSMAASALRRTCWLAEPFNERIQYSEDIAWTWRMRQLGWQIAYVPDAIVMHSHNYTLRQWYRRQYGEGKAEAHFYEWSAWDASWLRYSLLPCARQILGDWRYAVPHGYVASALYAPALRVAQLFGRRQGFRDGRRARKLLPEEGHASA